MMCKERYVAWSGVYLDCHYIDSTCVFCDAPEVLEIAAYVGMWLARIMEMHRVCTKCQGIDCFCDVEVTGEA